MPIFRLALLLFAANVIFNQLAIIIAVGSTGLAVILNMLLLLLCGLLYGLDARGYTTLASKLLLSGLWLVVTASQFASGGLASPVLHWYVVLLLAAGLLLGRRSALIVGVLSALVLLGIYFSGNPVGAQTQDTGTLAHPVIRLALQTTAYLTTALLVFIALRAGQMHQQETQNALKQALKELKAAGVARDYVNNVLQSMSNLLIVLDAQGIILMVNRATLELLGYKQHELVGRPFNEMILASDENPSTEDQESLTATALRKGILQDVPQVYLTRDGRRIPVSLSSRVMYDKNRNVIGVVCVSQDETERQNMERKLYDRVNELAALRQIDTHLSETLDIQRVLHTGLESAMALSQAQHGFIVYRSGGQRMTVTKGRYKGQEIDDTLLSSKIITQAMETRLPSLIPDLTHEKVITLVGNGAAMVFPLQSHVRTLGVMFIESDIKTTFTKGSFEFVKLLTGRITAALENARLYHASQQQLQDLREANERISNLEQLKTDMIRIASHDLRAPIGIIIGYVQLLRVDLAERMTEAEQEYLDLISDSTERMRGIIDEILSLERIQEIAENPLLDVVDMRQIGQRSYEAHLAYARAHNHRLMIHLSSEALPVRGDRNQLHEALSNLVTNAIKYTPEGGRIAIKIGRVGNSVVAKVVDNGQGVPLDQQETLFKPFNRPDTKENREKDGLGLGLHLVRNIIKRHHGELLFESTYGKGSTFGFRIPLARDDQG